jgi:hypothetical protein
MRMPRFSFHIGLSTTLFCLTSIQGLYAQTPTFLNGERDVVNSSLTSTEVSHTGVRGPIASSEAKLPVKNGIIEMIPQKYKERYEGWKNEFLAAETGRRQWELYEHNDAFMLTIMISDEDKHGAGTRKYMWDDNGKLIAATVVLGSRINEGYPNPIYYPVMNALAPDASAAMVKNNVLAAAKIAHEFGHVKQVAGMNGATYRLQNQLIPLYNEILLKNGRNTKDPRLVELAAKMGGTPVEIWEDREYWGEANAMLFLRDRITDQSAHRELFGRINRSVALYARDFSERFEQIK